MKTKKLNLTTVLLFVAAVAFGQQESAFKVLVNKGKNEVKSGESWLPVKTGSSLKAGDELRVSENAYVGLIHVTGKPLEVKDAGKYKVADLAAKIKEGPTVLNKYTDFILSSNTQKKNNLNATGAVHRGVNEIKVYLPKPEVSVVYNDKVTFSWDTENSTGPYTVFFTSMFGDDLKKIETTTNSVTIDLGDASFANEDNIRINIQAKGGSVTKSADNAYGLKRLSKADVNRFKAELSEVKASLADETAINKLFLAGYYEKNNLLVDAITAYQDAIKLAPDVQDIKAQYNDFLLRNAIKEPPVKK